MQKLPRKEGWFGVILIEGHRLMQFNVIQLMQKVTDNKFAHIFSTGLKLIKNVIHFLHCQRPMLCWRQVQAAILNKFKLRISLLTTAIVLLNESGSELSQPGLSPLMIGPERL